MGFRTLVSGLIGMTVVATMAAPNVPQRTPALQALTVPADRLPEGCALASARGATTNPWVGNDRRVLSALRQTVERMPAPRMPDAMPLTRAEETALLMRLADGVAEGYAATYSEFGNEIAVSAVRYAATPEPLLPPRVVQFEMGLIRAFVSGPVGPCRRAIEAHLKTL